MTAGPRPEDLERLAADLRVLDRTGIERATWSWDRHKAERAAFGAGLGLFARDHVSDGDYVALVEPMAEALPWLLPRRRPAPRLWRETDDQAAGARRAR